MAPSTIHESYKTCPLHVKRKVPKIKISSLNLLKRTNFGINNSVIFNIVKTSYFDSREYCI